MCRFRFNFLLFLVDFVVSNAGRFFYVVSVGLDSLMPIMQLEHVLIDPGFFLVAFVIVFGVENCSGCFFKFFWVVFFMFKLFYCFAFV